LNGEWKRGGRGNVGEKNWVEMGRDEEEGKGGEG